MLGLQGEKEARGEVLDRQYAGSLVGGRIWVKISMGETDDIINDGKEKPGEVKTGGKHQYAVTP